MDRSNVYHVSILDPDIAAERDPSTPWTFETDAGQWYFRTEAEACSMQRAYRRAHGFDPLSGERLFKRC